VGKNVSLVAAFELKARRDEAQRSDVAERSAEAERSDEA